MRNELDILVLVQSIQKMRASLIALFDHNPKLIEKAKKIYVSRIEIDNIEVSDEDPVEMNEYEKFLTKEYREIFCNNECHPKELIPIKLKRMKTGIQEVNKDNSRNVTDPYTENQSSTVHRFNLNEQIKDSFCSR